MKVPVLLLIFNRPDKTREVLQSIARYKPAKLYIAGDGPKDVGQKDLIEETRKVALNISWPCKTETLFRDVNLGCKIAVSKGIDWFFRKEEFGIILEDDCVPNESFFHFCEELLEKYKADNRVGMISGINQFAQKFDLPFSYYFTSNASIWGWASWRRAWDKYDVEMSDWPKLKKDGNFLKRHTFSLLERWRRRATYDDVYFNRIDTWDFQWTFARQKSNLLSVVPSGNLIQNIGMDDEGTHLKNQRYLDELPISSLEFPLKHPDSISINHQFDRLLSKQIVSEGILRNILYLLVKRPLKNRGLL